MLRECIKFMGPGALVLSACGDPGSDVAFETTAATTSPTFTATPNTELNLGVLIVLEGSHFPAATSVLVGQCPKTATQMQTDCYYDTVTTDSRGQFSTSLGLFRTVYEHSCFTAGECLFAASVTGTITPSLTVPLSFAVQPAMGQFGPTTDLADLQAIDFFVNTSSIETGTWEFAQCPGGTSVAPGEAWPSSCGPRSSYPYTSFNLLDSFVARYTVRPDSAPAFDCNTPDACMLTANGGPNLMVITRPMSFKALGPITTGTLSVQPSPAQPGQTLSFSGASWAANGTVVFQICPSNGDQSLCQSQKNLVAQPDGTFSTSVAAPSYLGTFPQFNPFKGKVYDCTVAPGACVVSAYDSRDPSSTLVQVPLTIASSAARAGVAELQLRTDLVNGLMVRVQGSGWAPNTQLLGMACSGSGFDTCAQLSPSITTDANGSFRVYTGLYDQLGCTQAGNCFLVITDDRALTATAVRTPIVFSTALQVAVTSHYDETQESLYQQGLTTTGLSDAKFQYNGMLGLLYVLVFKPLPTGSHFPVTGSAGHTTTYSANDYRTMSNFAARYDYTLDEFQKAGAMFYVSYLNGTPTP